MERGWESTAVVDRGGSVRHMGAQTRVEGKEWRWRGTG